MSCVEISPTGYCFESGRRLSWRDVDFALNMHYEYPKMYDIFSFYAVWIPPDAFLIRGYREFTQNILTHDDFLHASGTSANDHIARSIAEDCLHLEPELQLFPSPAGHCLEPVSGARKLAYVGTNWDSKKPGGRHGFLRGLDKTGKLVIYGPERVGKRRVWKGYKSYAGKIPFDGVSLVRELNRQGVSLVFSLPSHIEAGLASNRLFESAAAGAVIIYDQNPFGREHFGDSLLYVDTGLGEAEVCQQILDHLEWINDNPEAATELAKRAQHIFKKKFALDKLLGDLYDNLPGRCATLASIAADSSEPRVKLIYILAEVTQERLQVCVEDCVKQDYDNVSVLLVVPEEEEGAQWRQWLSDQFRQEDVAVDFFSVTDLSGRVLDNMGGVLTEVLRDLAGNLARDEASDKGEACDYFTIVTCYERIHHNHLSAQARLVRANPEALVAATCGVFCEQPSEPGQLPRYRVQNAVNFAGGDDAELLGYGRFIFARALLAEPLFRLLPYLNRKALAALIGDRQVAHSFLATSLLQADAALFAPPAQPNGDDDFLRDLYPDFGL